MAEANILLLEISLAHEELTSSSCCV